MIEAMKTVTVICLSNDRRKTVDALGDLGILHVRDVQPPESEELGGLLRQHDRIERAIDVLAARKPGDEGSGASAAETADLTEIVLQAVEDMHEAEETITKCTRALTLLQPWGSFSTESITALRERGLQVVLSSANEGALPELPPGCVLQEISRRKTKVFFAVIAPADCRLGIDADPLPEITDRGLLEDRLAEAKRVVSSLDARLDGWSAQIDSLKARIGTLAERIAFVRAREGMGSAARLCYLQGYVPAAELPKLNAAAQAHGWAIRATDPDEDDRGVPTKMTLPAWLEPIRIVFKGLGILPGYREIDISACFLVFFSIFFAMLIGDAAYGALFLAATLFARRKFPEAPAPPFQLFMILSVATIVWGVLTGTYFGIDLPAGHVLTRLPTVAYLGDAANVQRLCFLLGAIHLTAAHSWNALVIGARPKALGELAWVPILWGNYFLALRLVLNAPSSPLMKWLYIIGIVGVICFSGPQRNPLKTIGAGMGALAMGGINSFVDVVSYVRLFAVGAASVKVASSFNEMAGATGTLPAPLAALIGALILVFGHGLNIMLGAMGVLVHGIRLNVLEFAGHVGLEFSGTEYAPLRRNVSPAAE